MRGVPDDLGSFLAGRLQSARDDAERIARELAQNGYLTPEQAARLTDAVDGAVGRARDMVAGALREPQRVLAGLRALGDVEDVAGRIDALERAVVRLEEAIAAIGSGAMSGRRG